ncbi:MAG: YdcF family protein [Rhizobiaceae bacterium]|nr:YdcF family protein [Rhizobiaceae bacterium]
MADSVSAAGTVGRAVRPRGRTLRAVFWVAGFAALAFVFGFGLFSSHIGRLATPNEPQDADAIIVLTGGQARIDAAVDLLKAGKGKRLLISGVNPQTSPEDIQRFSGADEALFSCCIDIDRAADTVANAMESAKWMSANAFGSAILVTNNYHMPRSLLEMKRFGAGARILPYPVVNTRIDRGEWLTNTDALRVLFTEYAKYIAAVARDAFDGTPDAAPFATAAAH